MDRSGCVATITLNRPAVRNALDAGAVAELTGRLRDAETDSSVRVVQLAAAGTCFSAGADLRTMRRMGTASNAENLADARGIVEMLRSLHGMSKPTVARVQGATVAAGMGLVACCDVAIASEDAFFSLSEVRLGLVPAMVSPYIIEALGLRTARRLMLTAERMDAAQALQLGLVHEVVPVDELASASERVIRRLLRGAPGAHAATKGLLREIANRPLDAATSDHTAQVLARRRSSAEGQAGVRAFLDKAQPPWATAAAGGDCKP